MSFFDNEEVDVINSPSLINSEYYSDILAFRLSFQNHFNFVDADNAYDISVGSISSKRFAINQRLKLKHSITDGLNLHVSFFEIEDFEISRSHLMFGLGYDISKSLEIVINTAFFSEKSENDLGLAINFKPSLNNNLRFFINLPDFAFNERIETDAQNLKDTFNLGIIGNYKSEDGYQLEYYISNNSKLERLFKDIDEIYQFSELRYGLRSVLQTSQLTYNILLEAFNGTEGQYLRTSQKEVWNRKGLKTLIQIQLDQWTAGVESNWRTWELNSQVVRHTNIMPHMWYRQNLNSVLSSIDMGLEFSIHKGTGPLALRESSDSNHDVNGRFNLRPNFKISEKSFLNILLSLDLDDGSWEGGGGQFQVLF